MRKRITSLLLTLAMLLSLLPAMGVTASAAEPEWTTVNTYAELEAALSNQNSPDNIKLGSDIDTGTLNSGVGILESLEVKGRKQLDLNGHTLRMYSEKTAVYDMFTIKLGDLTVLDSSSGQKGTILGSTYNDSCYLFDIQSNGKLTLNSGTLKVDVRKSINRWRRVIYCYAGGTVTINGGTLHVAPETYEGKNNAYGQYFEEEYKDLVNGHCGYTLMAENSCKVTINGGTFEGPVRLDAGGSDWRKNEPRVIITNGTFKKKVMLNGPGDGTKPLTVIRGGVFLDYVQAWAAASFDEKNPFTASEVTVNGGEFHDTFWIRPTFPSSDIVSGGARRGYHLSARLMSATIYKRITADPDIIDLYKVYVDGKRDNSQKTAIDIYNLASEVLGRSAVQNNNGCFSPLDIASYRSMFSYHNTGKPETEGYLFELKALGDTPTKIIPNAWGVMESVTLDGNKIDYAKDWNGTAVVIDNSKDHTITFKWKDLENKLKTAGYSYDAQCMRYTSGDTTGLIPTDQIPTGTEYSFTIRKGADPRVYSFDLRLDLKKGSNPVNTFANQHIVKLVVSEAPVVESDPTIAGSVYYTSGIVYGNSISTAASVTPADATKAYQWQRSTDSGNTWTDIDGATRGSYTPVAADMGDAVRIRVKVTAEGYLGEIVGAAVKVSKAANDNTPAPPAVEAQKDDSGAYKKFVISDFNSNQEYVYTTSAPTSGNEWPTGTPISSATVEGLDEGSTYYIYTRFKETDTQTAGSKISSSSVLLDDVTKLNRIILTDASGKEYSSYGNGNTIYIKKGESVTLTATKNPDGANKWSAFTFKSQYGASAPFTVTDPTAPVASGSTISSVTIRGDEAGTGTLAAEYSGYTPQSYGTWRVHVYENVSDIGTGAEITVSPTFADATMYPGETMTLPAYTVTANPEGALADYHYEWYVREPATSAGSMGSGNNVKENTYFKVNDDGTITAKTVHTGSEDSQYKMVLLCAVKGEYDKTKLASFNVTVTEAPVIELTGVTVAPAKVNLELNATYQLSAVKQPVNAEGTLTWTSDKPAVAEVDNTGKVTAKAQGTAKITVTCNGKSASCTVTVGHTHDTDGQPWVYMDPGMHIKTCTAGDDFKVEVHDFGNWTPNSDNTTHSRHCNKCKKSGETENYTETANHNWQWKVDTAATPNAEGKKHEECVDCGVKRSENTTIPMLPSIKVENLTVAKPVKDAAAAAATTTDSAYTVAYTEWTAADGTPLAIGDKFQPGTVYTAKITLETSGAGVFSAKSTYNPIEGKAATATPVLTGDTHADSVILSYTFDATEGSTGGSTGGGGGSGGGGVTTYAITVKDSKNGDVTASHKSAAKGTTVTLTVDPDKGYVLDTLTVLDDKDKEIKLTEKNGKYVFTMPSGKVTVAGRFKVEQPAGKHPFTDIPSGAYYENAVIWAADKGITGGTSATTFAPNGICTRAQAVTFLWRAAGSPAPKSMNSFADVPADAYYAKAVAWAVENGITSGTGGGKFSPNATCTRAQIVTFLYRAAGSPAVSGGSVFSDVKADAYYADAVTWVANKGITGGIGNGLFGSDNNCTRAQIVTFLYRYVE